MRVDNSTVHKQPGTIVFMGELRESKRRKGLLIRKFLLAFGDFKGNMQTCEFTIYGLAAKQAELIEIGAKVVVYFNLSGYSTISKAGTTTYTNTLVVRVIERAVGPNDPVLEMLNDTFSQYKVMESEDE
jgi:hypothetical protein